MAREVLKYFDRPIPQYSWYQFHLSIGVVIWYLVDDLNKMKKKKKNQMFRMHRPSPIDHVWQRKGVQTAALMKGSRQSSILDWIKGNIKAIAPQMNVETAWGQNHATFPQVGIGGGPGGRAWSKCSIYLVQDCCSWELNLSHDQRRINKQNEIVQ